MKGPKSRGLMRSFSLILPFILLFWGCSQSSSQKKTVQSVPQVTIQGIISGQEDYKNWEVFIGRKGYTSPRFKVQENGRFKMSLSGIQKGRYQFYYGKKSKKTSDYWSFQIPVYKSRVDLGWVRAQ
jgi:hypothetical protein